MATATGYFDNFPVKFNNVVDSCADCDTRPFEQLAQWTDRFELAINPSTVDLVVTNGTFNTDLSGWTAGSGWTWNAGSARITNDTGILEQAIAHTIGVKYRISFTISNFISSGAPTDVLNVLYGGVSITAYILNGIGANGTYSVYITPTGSGNLQFVPSSANVTLDLDNVTVESVNSSYLLHLYNTATNVLSGGLTYNLSSPYILPIGFNYLWSGFSVSDDGCYKLAIVDSSTNANLISNGTFASSLANWSVTSGSPTWVQSAGKATITIGTTKAISQAIIGLVDGVNYTVTFTISNLTGTVAAQFLGGTALIITTNGTYTMNAIYSASGSTNFTVTCGISTTAALDNVTGYAYVLSESYKIATTHLCTKQLSWTNESTNGFGYPYYYFYNGSITGVQYMRVESGFRNAKYPGNKNDFTDSGGNDFLYYGNSRKQKTLYIGAIPEYMHDALAIGLKHKDLFLDADRYTYADTDYTPEWKTDMPLLLAESQILIGKYTQYTNSID